ncbi:MAG: 4-hydroxy-3-methylbut-2-enyl diphosphate reductase [Isosphaeraceae bacterium]|jgi:4-hydroxy-3-methylbut-2-enyl diphosphate reductase|nr:MAG: 4-hydroxy-3-methylbut-2-enyl diphosphate reductase [Isosphaeraceae bacterium]
MRVIRATAMGLCFGVQDALEMVESIERPERVTIYGELVHNGLVQERLKRLGFRQAAEVGRERSLPETPIVLITAHGVSEAERRRLEAAGREVIDTTCPLVRRAHRAAVALQAQGYFVVIIGKPDHVEVRGLTGDLTRYAVVDRPEAARPYGAARIGLVCQTTTPPPLVRAIAEAVTAANPDAQEIRLVDTVCRPTRERQQAMDQLLDQVEAVVVVGGRHSNNTRALTERCRARGVRAWQVERAEELDPAWFAGIEVVGLTAGTSTLDVTIDEVERVLLAIGAGDRSTKLSAERGDRAPEPVS